MPPAVEAEPASPSPEPQPGFLVWARDTIGEAASFRIDEKGQVIEKLDGIRIEIDGVEWRWQEERITAAGEIGSGCGEVEGEGGESGSDGKSFATRASVSRIDEAEAQTIVPPQMHEDDATDFEHEVTLVRSVGPLLFVRQTTHVYGCGAHGNLGASALIWDIAKNGEIELDGEISDVDALRKKAERIMIDADDSLVSEDDEVTLSELLPIFTPEGDLELKLRFTGFACYACSDGEWSSYTKSVLLPAKQLPKTLLPYSKVPEAVRSFADGHPELTLGGFSAPNVNERWPAAGIAR